MLDDYNECQVVACRTLRNAIKNNKCSHAYLFEGDRKYAYDFCTTFIKEVLLYSCDNLSLNDKNDLLLQIDSGNYTELKIIEADGLWIKKEQLLDLQHDFSRKALVGSKRIYLIRDAEKLNETSANTMLKFLEEPNDDIMAVLITKNLSQVISTIVSRCQVIKLSNSADLINYSSIQKIQDNLELYNDTVQFIADYEHLGYESVINHSQLRNLLSKKENIETFFYFLQEIYSKILSIKIGKSAEFAFSDKKIFENILKKNSVDVIIRKINQIICLSGRVKYNVNVDLMLDKLIFGMDGDL